MKTTVTLCLTVTGDEFTDMAEKVRQSAELAASEITYRQMYCQDWTSKPISNFQGEHLGVVAVMETDQ